MRSILWITFLVIVHLSQPTVARATTIPTDDVPMVATSQPSGPPVNGAPGTDDDGLDREPIVDPDPLATSPDGWLDRLWSWLSQRLRGLLPPR